MQEKAWLRTAFKLNTSRSPKYKISSTSLFICPAPLNLTSKKTWCSGVPSASSNVGTKMENIWQTIHAYFDREYLCCFGYLDLLGKYNSVHFITFQTHWKENSICTPSLWKFTSFRSPTPQNFCDPPWGVRILSGTTHRKSFCSFWLITIYRINLSNPF